MTNRSQLPAADASMLDRIDPSTISEGAFADCESDCSCGALVIMLCVLAGENVSCVGDANAAVRRRRVPLRRCLVLLYRYYQMSKTTLFLFEIMENWTSTNFITTQIKSKNYEYFYYNKTNVQFQYRKTYAKVKER